MHSKNCSACTAGSLHTITILSYNAQYSITAVSTLYGPEVADLHEGAGGGPVPGVLVDEVHHHLLQPDGHLTQRPGHQLRQL